MRVIAKKILREFWIKHNDYESQLQSWYHEAYKENWKTPTAIKKEFPTASFIQDNRAEFNIKGNDYRLIVKMNYDYSLIWIRFIGTHNQYDKINAKTI